MKFVRLIAVILLIIGGLNWGLVGIFNFDLVATIFGTMSVLSRIVYIVVAISAIIVAIDAKKYLK
ncbi:DUF378 domain-containing protein [Lentisphaerota bacterium ZTH]|nr:DUF378 domain-containing protein [Lentisphaerota bacterium]WET05706.1 DUF378 domain-containing protein [Lentisphaerota bacterium ZTH]